ncbi:hypothetical protein DFH28DRAFT_939789 [Melampsora americana]|nr:hypothetical protein DFH28DRAFT_939789 [Melampsora americana]
MYKRNGVQTRSSTSSLSPSQMAPSNRRKAAPKKPNQITSPLTTQKFTKEHAPTQKLWQCSVDHQQISQQESQQVTKTKASSSRQTKQAEEQEREREQAREQEREEEEQEREGPIAEQEKALPNFIVANTMFMSSVREYGCAIQQYKLKVLKCKNGTSLALQLFSGNWRTQTAPLTSINSDQFLVQSGNQAHQRRPVPKRLGGTWLVLQWSTSTPINSAEPPINSTQPCINSTPVLIIFNEHPITSAQPPLIFHQHPTSTPYPFSFNEPPITLTQPAASGQVDNSSKRKNPFTSGGPEIMPSNPEEKTNINCSARQPSRLASAITVMEFTSGKET